MPLRMRIEYEASWRNSFLDGSNNESLPKNGRKFIGSMTELKKEGNFIERGVTQDTVMGILNRLIGDQRKLYQARQDKEYYFATIEEHIIFEDKPKDVSSEIVYIRNISGSEDQQSFTGMIKSNDPVFQSDYSAQLWGVLWLDLNQLYEFIHDYTYQVQIDTLYTPLTVIEQLESLNKLKPLSVEQDHTLNQVVQLLTNKFKDIPYLNDKMKIMPISLYCSALYLQLERLQQYFDLSSAVTKAGGISGISKRGFTKKDFMARYTTGKKKLVWGNPYLMKKIKKGEGEVSSILQKASGMLEIILDIPDEKANELMKLIDNSGVSSFYLGKKGLAYVDDIRVIRR